MTHKIGIDPSDREVSFTCSINITDDPIKRMKLAGALDMKLFGGPETRRERFD